MRAMRILALVAALTLAAPAVAAAETHRTSYSTSEATDLYTAANYLGMTPGQVQTFGVMATRFVLELSGAQPQPLSLPDHTGPYPVEATYPAGSDAQAALHWVAGFYGVDGPRAQRIGATFMVFLAGRDAAAKGLPYPTVTPPTPVAPAGPPKKPTTPPPTTKPPKPQTTFAAWWNLWFTVAEDVYQAAFDAASWESAGPGPSGAPVYRITKDCSILTRQLERLAEARRNAERYQGVTPKLLELMDPTRFDDAVARCEQIVTGDLSSSDQVQIYYLDLADRWAGPWLFEVRECSRMWLIRDTDAMWCGPVPFG